LEKPHSSFSLLSACYPEEIPLEIKEAQNSTFDAAISNCTWQSGLICVVSFLRLKIGRKQRNVQPTSWLHDKLTKM